MMPLSIHGHEVTLFWNLMGFGQGKYKLQLLVTMELPHKWRDFNLAESGEFRVDSLDPRYLYLIVD